MRTHPSAPPPPAGSPEGAVLMELPLNRLSDGKEHPPLSLPSPLPPLHSPSPNSPKVRDRKGQRSPDATRLPPSRPSRKRRFLAEPPTHGPSGPGVETGANITPGGTGGPLAPRPTPPDAQSVEGAFRAPGAQKKRLRQPTLAPAGGQKKRKTDSTTRTSTTSTPPLAATGQPSPYFPLFVISDIVSSTDRRQSSTSTFNHDAPPPPAVPPEPPPPPDPLRPPPPWGDS